MNRMNWLAGSVAAILLGIWCGKPAAALSEAQQMLRLPDRVDMILQQQDGYLHTTLVDQDGVSYDPPETALPQAAEEQHLVQAQSLPESYDLREESCVTSVKNQGSEGLCWAFAVLSACESNLLKQGVSIPEDWLSENGELDLSEAHLGWFPYTEPTNWTDLRYGDWLELDGKGSGGGNATVAAYALGSGLGAQLEDNVPYTDWEAGYSEYQRYASAFRLHASNMLPDSDGALDAESIETVKRWILEDGGVYASYYSGGVLSDDFAYYQTKRIGHDYASHAITIVGWDDQFDRSHFRAAAMPEENGAWLCKNSWGPDVMDNGYFWMSYEETTLGEFTQFQMQPASATEQVYQYDGIGSMSAFSMDAVSNVFTAETDGSLTELSFYNSEANSSTLWYQAQVYLLDADANSPEDGMLAAETEGTVFYHGMKTISFPKPVSLQKGQRFAVVLQLRNDTESGETAYQYIERNVEQASGLSEYFYAAPGQSYVKWGNYGWRDTTELTSRDGTKMGNVVLKAVVQQATAESYSMKQLTEACALAESLEDGTELTAYSAAQQMLTAAENGTCTQEEIDLAALQLLTDLEAEGVVSYPAHLYDSISDAKLGDCNWDSSVTLSDATLALTWYAQSAVKDPIAITARQFLGADVDQDGTIALRDATLILTYYAEAAVGNSVTFEELLQK